MWFPPLSPLRFSPHCVFHGTFQGRKTKTFCLFQTFHFLAALIRGPERLITFHLCSSSRYIISLSFALLCIVSLPNTLSICALLPGNVSLLGYEPKRGQDGLLPTPTHNCSIPWRTLTTAISVRLLPASTTTTST